jgi:uncharacterized protein (DUF362 family)
MSAIKPSDPKNSLVAVCQGSEPAALTLDVLRKAIDPGDLRNRLVLIKPNVGFKFPPGSGVVTHPETVRGVIRFCKEAGASGIWVGDSAIFGLNTNEALETTGIAAVARQEDVRLVNLDAGEPVLVDVPEPMAIDRLKVSSLALEPEVIISVPVMKTHMHVVATLGIKNMKGCLYKRQKQRLHHLAEEDRFSRWHAYRNLDRAIADMFSVLPPNLTVVDGTVGLEGLGPMLGDPKPLGLVLASRDPLAAEIAALYLMGFSAEDVPHVELSAHKSGLASLRWDGLNLDRAEFEALRSPFRPAIAEDISAKFPQFKFLEGKTCSACMATLMAFMQTFGENYADKEPVSIALGQELDPDQIDHKTVLLGKCTAKIRKHGYFVEGCPPVPSDIVRAIEALDDEA